MLHEGPVPYFVHSVIEYLAAALLIAAPFLFNFHADAAKAVSIVTGVIVLIVAATTAGSRTSLVKSFPLGFHILFDFVLVAFLIATPFLFGFSDETNPTAFFIVLGVLDLLLHIATRFPIGEARTRAKH